MILKDAPMPGIFIEDQFGIGQAAGHIDRVAAGNHDVLITIGDQNRLQDRGEILWRLFAPGLDRLELPEERFHRDRLVAIRLALLQPLQEVLRSAAAIRGRGEEEIVLRVPEGQHPLDDERPGYVAYLLDALAPCRARARQKQLADEIRL